MGTVTISFILALWVAFVNAVPPRECHQNFNHGDCGGAPRRVFYYYRPGSRCEVATWKGCRPNLNMFTSEYECKNTCIFGKRVRPGNYHNNKHIIRAPGTTKAEAQTQSPTTAEQPEGTKSSGLGNRGTGDATGATQPVDATGLVGASETGHTTEAVDATDMVDATITVDTTDAVEATTPEDGETNATGATTEATAEEATTETP